ncbi:MAG: hypothetical protein ACREJX_03820 [Polyangiaceae bacterium]
MQSNELSHIDPALRDLVREYDIRWQGGREQAVVDGRLRTIGLKLELSAIHPHPAHAPEPGCPECGPVVRALERVADAVLPKDERRSSYEVSVPLARHVIPRRGGPEMTATITILHRDNVNDPVDACEERCLADMTSALEGLGAKRAGI